MEENGPVLAKLWQDAASGGTIARLVSLAKSDAPYVLGVSTCNEQFDWTYYISVISDEEVPGLDEHLLPAATWAVFSGRGSQLSVVDMEVRIVSEWLPTSGYEYDNTPDIEAYIDPDGGFGYGMDMDNWNPGSLPYNCLCALQLLRQVGFADMSHPVFQGIKKYLNATGPEQWFFTLQSSMDYPHASFYDYSEEYNKVESTGIIVGLSSFVIGYFPEEPVYEKVMAALPGFIKNIESDNLGDMGASAYIGLVAAMGERGITGYDFAGLNERLKTVVNNTIQRNPEQWQSYGYRPSDFIYSKDSFFYPGNEDVVEKELDFLAQTKPAGDVWPISWTWLDNSSVYPTQEAISLHVSKARKAIEKMLFLKSFGRAE